VISLLQLLKESFDTFRKNLLSFPCERVTGGLDWIKPSGKIDSPKCPGEMDSLSRCLSVCSTLSNWYALDCRTKRQPRRMRISTKYTDLICPYFIRLQPWLRFAGVGCSTISSYVVGNNSFVYPTNVLPETTTNCNQSIKESPSNENSYCLHLLFSLY
jgi:hypothetical protein